MKVNIKNRFADLSQLRFVLKIAEHVFLVPLFVKPNDWIRNIWVRVCSQALVARMVIISFLIAFIRHRLFVVRCL